MTGVLFEEERAGGALAPFTADSYECTVLSSSCHIGLKEHPCYLVELQVIRKIQLPSGEAVSSPSLSELRAHGFLQVLLPAQCCVC